MFKGWVSLEDIEEEAKKDWIGYLYDYKNIRGFDSERR